jgi:5-methylcytosine-specific restriction endonuclease McrA
MIATAHPTLSSAAALSPAGPSLELLEARQLRDALKVLLRKEQADMADFLIALADFDRRRGWEALGHANVFAFLHVELRLSKSAAFYRKSAAELLQAFPEVIEPLRDGRLCLSTVAELAKVLTEENQDVVAPRFFGFSAREVQELVAELQPRQVPSTRMVVTRVLSQSVASPVRVTQPRLTTVPASDPTSDSTADTDPNMVPPSRVLTSDFANGGGRLVSRRDEIVPLTVDVRRVHFNVGKRVVQKLEAAREGLSHAIPGATMEQVLEAALDLLLEKQARARGLVKRPRAKLVEAAPRAEAQAVDTKAQRLESPAPSDGQRTMTDGQWMVSATCSNARPEGRAIDLPTTGPRPPRREGPREAIPAAVRRAVWDRDAGRCSWPLDGGGCCGSTHRLELDHVIPWAEWGPPTVENLRLVCGRHNAVAARRHFGPQCTERSAGQGSRPGG